MTTGEGTAAVTLPSDVEILITRGFDAPRALVWRAWTTPELIRRWWAGREGAMTVAEVDLRVGGAWRYAMRSTHGRDVAFHGTYEEVVPEERLRFSELMEGMPDGVPPAITTVTFLDAEGGGTVVEQLMRCPSQELRDMIIGSGMEKGAQSQLDVLEALLAELG